MDICVRIEKFKDDLSSSKYSIDEIINKYIIFGTPYIFKDDEETHYKLIRKVAEFFGVNQRNVFIVGSSKLGFSISPPKLWNEIDWNLEKESDIDVVIISNDVFERYWKQVLEFKESKLYTSDIKRDIEFLEYFFRGWIRPDKFPNDYNGGDEWFEFFRQISYKEEFGGRKIALAIYKEDYFFMRYHRENLKYIKNISVASGGQK